MNISLYDILGISPSASEKDIKNAYKQLAKRYHPDTNHGNPEAEEKFKLIKNAYEILGDANKRSIYDKAIQEENIENQAYSYDIPKNSPKPPTFQKVTFWQKYMYGITACVVLLFMYGSYKFYNYMETVTVAYYLEEAQKAYIEGAIDVALAHLDVAYGKKPESYKVNRLRALIFMEKKEYQLASLAWAAVLKSAEREPTAKDFYYYAVCQERMGRFDPATESLKKALSLNPADAIAWNLLGEITLYHLRRPQPALTYFEKALQNMPTNQDALIGRAIALVENQRIEEGEIAFENLLDDFPEHGKLNYYYGIYLVQYPKDTARACIAWKKADKAGIADATNAIKQCCLK